MKYAYIYIYILLIKKYIVFNYYYVVLIPFPWLYIYHHIDISMLYESLIFTSYKDVELKYGITTHKMIPCIYSYIHIEFDSIHFTFSPNIMCFIHLIPYYDDTHHNYKNRCTFTMYYGI